MRILRALMPKAAFVASFSAILLAIATVAPAHAATTPKANCFNVFVKALSSSSATGMWACLNQTMRQGYFDHGWVGDKDLQAHLFDPLIAQNQYFNVIVYPSNPVKTCVTNPNTGSEVCKAQYLLHYTIMEADGKPHVSCSMLGCGEASGTFTITLDVHGLIGAIE